MIRLFFGTGVENFSITFLFNIFVFFSHRARPCSTPQWAWVAYLAGKHASPTSVFSLVVGGEGGWKKVCIWGGSGCGEILMDREGVGLVQGWKETGNVNTHEMNAAVGRFIVHSPPGVHGGGWYKSWGVPASCIPHPSVGLVGRFWVVIFSFPSPTISTMSPPRTEWKRGAGVYVVPGIIHYHSQP